MRCEHSNIISIIDVIEDSPNFYLVIPSANGNIISFIRKGQLEEYHKIPITYIKVITKWLTIDDIANIISFCFLIEL